MYRSYLILIILSLWACKDEPVNPNNLQDYADNLLIRNYLEATPGATIAVARGDKIIYRGARGLASFELNIPLEEDHVFRIGSVTKQYTAVAILKLVEEGKINLNDPLSKFLSQYPNGNNISILQLLNHTSGIKSYTSIEGIMSGPIRLDVTTNELIDSFKNLPVDFEPGTDWSYNNSGYVLLGGIIESISGLSWHDYLQQTLFIPHKLMKTEYGGDHQLIVDMVSGYTSIKIEGGENLAPAGILSMTQPHAAGALVSNVEDMLRWNQLLHRGELLKSDLYQRMISPEGKAIDTQYGFGIKKRQFRGQTMLEHGGGIHGFSSYLLYLPESEIGVAIIQNSDTPIFGMSHSELALRIAAFAIGKPFPESIVVDLNEKTLMSYEGVYQNNDMEKFYLKMINGVLTFKESGGTLTSLKPISKNGFIYHNGLSMIKIKRSSDENIKGIQIIAAEDSIGQFAALTDEVLAKDSEVIVSKSQKQRILGHYQGVPGLLRVEMNSDEKIFVKLRDQDAFEVHPQTTNLYFLSATGATLEFAEGDKAPRVTLSQGGKSTVLSRVNVN